MVFPNTKQLKLQDALKQELQSGNFQVGDRFYTEKEIMSKYQVSSVTVARAVGEMTQQGYFERKRKLGTFVRGTRTIPGMSFPGFWWRRSAAASSMPIRAWSRSFPWTRSSMPHNAIRIC